MTPYRPANGLASSPLLCALFALVAATSAQAVPSFAEQTGLACSVCHTQAFGPNLTSYGREFKLRGYVDGGGSHPLVAPLSAMMRASYTHLGSGVAAGSEEPGYGARDNFAHDESSIFLAGRLLPRVGIFSQVTYNGIADTVALDNTDIRFANGTRLGGQAIEYGVSVNNSPTVQDVWNTTPVWGYPYASSPLAPTPGAAALIDGGLDGQVAGATAYALVGGVLYVEGGAYRGFSKDAQKALGTFAVDENELRGTAPYWRLTLQNTDAGWNGHYLALGTFGMHADIRPGRVRGVGTDTITDLGVDLNYQYLANPEHIFEAKATYIYEDAKLGASFNPILGSALNASDRLHTFRLNTSYTFDASYTFTAAYTGLWGTTDGGRIALDPVSGNRTGSPDSDAYSFEFDWIPFGKTGSYLAPYYNWRIGVIYTGYTRFNGSQHDYDGNGRNGRNASDNNTLLVNFWFIM